MQHFISILKGSFLFSLLMLLLTGCNPKPAPEKVIDEKDDPEKKVEQLQISGKYHYLYCTSAEFNSLKDRTNQSNKGQGLVLFKNNISGVGMTLHGWSYKTGNKPFTDDPNIKFSIAKDTLSFQSGSYIGDFILSWKDVKAIKALLGPGSKYNFVVFRPYYIGTTNTLIAYQIHLSESPTQANIADSEKLFLTGKVLNPIPPGGGQDFEE